MKLRIGAFVVIAGLAGAVALANTVTVTGAGLSVTGSLTPDPATVGQPVTLTGSGTNITNGVLGVNVTWKVTGPTGAVLTSGSRVLALAPGQTLSASTSFTPTAAGTYTGTVTFKDRLGTLTVTATATAQ